MGPPTIEDLGMSWSEVGEWRSGEEGPLKPSWAGQCVEDPRLPSPPTPHTTPPRTSPHLGLP